MQVEYFEGQVPYLTMGEAGPPLLVIGGGQGFVRRAEPGSFLRDARRTARLLPAGRRLVVLGYDPDPAAGLSAEALVEQVARFVEDRFDGPVMVAGISYGGMVAVRLAARRPDLVSKLSMTASAHRFSAEGLARTARQIDSLQAGAAERFIAEFAQLFRRPWFNALVGLRIRLGGRRLAQGLADPRVIIAYLAAMRDARPVDLSAVRASALVVGGAEDQFYGEGAMQEAAEGMANGRLRLLDGETHMAPIERRKAVSSMIAAFLTEDAPLVAQSGKP